MSRDTGKEKPIIFSAEQVRAILEGRKIQTRRVVRPQPVSLVNAEAIDHVGNGEFVPVRNKRHGPFAFKCPYGQPDDVLWVRETWCECWQYGGSDLSYGYRADGQTRYKANMQIGPSSAPKNAKWRPSIHMPREAARLFLRVKNIRVERLQDITEEDARAEGAPKRLWYAPWGKGEEAHIDISGLGPPYDRLSYRNGFATLWDRLCAKRGYGWDTNPWVFVIEFEVEKEADRDAWA